MAPQLPPQDEWEFDQPHLFAELPGGGVLNSDSILWYFMNSPWFDPSSNNNTLVNQVIYGPHHHILNNRKAFEERLQRDYPYGTQYVVAYEPKAEGEPWVIQRQEKTVDENTGKTGRIEVTATFYTQGTKIYMARSVLDILHVRMLSVSTQLEELMELSHSMSHFSPSAGHTYLPPSFDLAKASGGSRTGSRAGSPSPAAADGSQSQAQPSAQAASDDPLSTFSDGFFLRSLDLTETFFEEYVDENPLQGEPGSFVLTHSWRNTVTRREEEKKRVEQQAAAAQAAASQLSTSTAAAVAAAKQDTHLQSGLQSSTSTPKAVTPAAESFSRKGSVASLPKPGKEKRRKSRGPGSLASPLTPTGPHV